MKILHLSSVRVTYPGGTEKVIWELAKRQAKNNQVTILQTNLYEKSVSFKETEVKENVEIITCRNDYFLRGFGYSVSFKNKLKRIWEKFDVIHIHGHGRFTSNFALKYLNGKKPVIYSPQGFFHNRKNKLFKMAYNILFRGRVQSATISTALTEVDYELFEYLRVKRDSIRILPGGINLRKFKGISKRRVGRFKKKYDLNKNTLLFVGRVHESKGLQYVLESIEKINCKLLIVGKDEGYMKRLEEIAMNLKIRNKIIFLGKLSDEELLESYFSSDIFVLFSEWEGFGIVLIEAMASGLPPIVSDRGSLPILIKDEVNGLVVKFKKVNDLKLAISRLLKNKNLRKNLASHVKETAKKYDWGNINKTANNIYNEAIKKFEK